jgi:hypothetical protein
MKGYIYALYRNGEQIDQTSIDEKNMTLAKHLFYGEFGYKKERGDKVTLIRIEEEE